MSRSRISQADAESFQRTGFLVVKGLFDANEVRRVADDIAQLRDFPETPGEHMVYSEETESGGQLLNRIENFVPYHRGLADIVNGEKMRGTVSALFGEPAILFKEKINFKLPGGGGFEAHQDAQAGWNDYAKLFITAAVAVDPATVDNGCLEIGHWDHRRQLVGDLWEPLHGTQLDGVEFVAYPMAAGDAAFFDSYVPHRSAPNRTSESRRVLYVTYNPAAQGDHREQYYADKRKSFPPDCEREPGRNYAYRV